MQCPTFPGRKAALRLDTHCMALVVLLAVFAMPARAVDVAIPDAGLESALRLALAKPTGVLQDTELAGLTALDASGQVISNLTGIEFCTSLQELNLNNNLITDISALAALNSLSKLRLEVNQISDLSSLAGLTALTQLYAGSNNISDITALSALTNLTSLGLDNNKIVSIAAVSGLLNLTQLNLYNNQISDVSPVAGLSNLITLELSQNAVSDLTELAGLSNLTVLTLESNHITDISPLATLTALTDLFLSINQISDISALAGLTDLARLGLEQNTIDDISILSGLSELSRLDLQQNVITSVSPLSGLTALTVLWLARNQIADITPLAGLSNLSELYLSWNEVSDATAVSGLAGLTALDLSFNSISDLTPLSGLSNLTYLYLDSNKITSLAPIAGLTQLRTLLVGINQIASLSDLGSLTNVTVLRVDHNSLTDVSPLAALTGLAALNVSHNQISDLSPLLNLSALFNLDCSHNNITDLSTLVNNAGIATGDVLYVGFNPLGATACTVQLPALEGRGVIVDKQSSCGTGITIPDPVLEAAIRTALAIPTGPLLDTQLANLASLDCRGLGVANLSGIEYCVNLTQLLLGDNRIVDITPLAGLIKLQYLDLPRNLIANYDALSGLTELTGLFLLGNPGTNLNPLAGLTKLTELSLGRNGTTNIDALSNLTSLTNLTLTESPVSDISSLAGLTSLETLFLSANSISNIGALGGLTGLSALYLTGNVIADYTPLSGLINLTALNLSGNLSSDLAPLATLTNLTDFAAARDNLVSIDVVNNMPLLTSLWVSDNQITDLAPLAGLTALTQLDISFNAISDLSPLSSISALELLITEHNEIASLLPLAGLASLDYLNLGKNQICDLGAIVDNAAIASGDTLLLEDNPLTQAACGTQIPALEGRGVTVYADTSCTGGGALDCVTSSEGQSEGTNEPPVINFITPEVVDAASGGTFRIYGSNLSPGLQAVIIDGVAVTSFFANATTVDVSAPPHATGDVDVSVQTVSGTALSPNQLHYRQPVANVACEGALPLSEGVTEFNNLGACITFAPPQHCSEVGPLWFSYTPTQDGTLGVQFRDCNFSTIQAFESCGAFAFVSEHYDEFPCGTFHASLLAGQTYLVSWTPLGGQSYPLLSEVTLGFTPEAGVSLHGTVRDASTGEVLEGVTVHRFNALETTNAQGQYEIVVPPSAGGWAIQFTLPGYESRNLSGLTGGELNVSLAPIAPAAPMGLSGAAGAGVNSLRWSANTESDLAGYNVYASEAAGPFVLLNGAPIQDTEFVDPGAVPGTVYTYHVTAVDTDGNESVPSADFDVHSGRIEVYVPNVTAPVGTEARIPINVKNATGINPFGMDIDFRYAAGFLLNGDVGNVRVERTAVTSLVSPVFNTSPAGQVRIASIGEAQTLVGDGHIFDVYLKLTDQVAGQCDTMSLAGVTFYDNSVPVPQPLMVDFSDTSDLCGDVVCIQGDLNDDKAVDESDVMLALQISVGKLAPTPCQLQASDMNGDRIINSADAIMIKRLIQNFPLNPPVAKSLVQLHGREHKTAGIALTVGDITGIPGELVPVPIAINDATGIAGLNLTIAFPGDPSKITLESVEPGTLGGEFTREENLGAGFVRLAFSTAQPTGNTGGNIAVLGFRIAESAEPGDVFPIALNEARLSGEFGDNLAWSEAVNRQGGTVTVKESPLNQALGALGTFQSIDGDHDAVLSQSEALAAGIDQQAFAAFDTNQSGFLELHELIEGAAGDSPIHRGDLNGDGHINLSELLRMVQLYNAGGYICDSSQEDGYAVLGVKILAGQKTLDAGCLAHSADYLGGGDAVINLSELLRQIQLYNMGAYSFCRNASEDNFCGL